jgi:hypothetical protein
MRRIPPLLALPAAVILIGCGSASHSAASKGSTALPSATARPFTPATPLSRAQAAALVAAVNLTSADVPGFIPTEKNAHRSAAERQVEADVLRCGGSTGAHVMVAQGSSKNFERRHSIAQLSVSSEVSVAPSAAVAARELHAIRSPHVRACLAHYMSQLLRSEQVGEARVGRVSIQQGTPPAPGASGSFAWRMTATFTVHGLRIPIYLDLLGFTYGPVQVSLVSTGVPVPLPAGIEEHLFTLLVERLEGYRPGSPASR